MMKGRDNMKLIDVLNIISKGELEEGTIVIVGGRRYKYECTTSGGNHDLLDSVGDTIFDNAYLTEVINVETEITPPDHNDEAESTPTQMSETPKIDLLDKDSTCWNDLYVEQKLDVLFNQINLVTKAVNNNEI